MKTYLVSADHVSPAYRATKLPVRVGSTDMGAGTVYYASVNPYGCGKIARTPEAAIRLLFSDNGCTNIRIEEC